MQGRSPACSETPAGALAPHAFYCCKLSIHMQLIDTHAHICFDSYDEDREVMMQRAYDAGVVKLVHPCCNLGEFGCLEELSKQYDGDKKINLYMSVGVHPCDIKKWDDSSFDLMDDLLKSSLEPGSKIKAVGETGLDYYHCTEPAEQARQRQIFQDQITLALKYKLPVIVHTRDAWEDTLKILQENFKEGSLDNGTIHCYTGDLDFAEAVMKIGFCVSWGGVLTYKKNSNFRDFAGSLDLSKVLLETDCPFLAPQANRGKRNEPSFMTEIAQVLADCYHISVEELAGKSTENAERLFKI